jgi:hypothetical protein
MFVTLTRVPLSLPSLCLKKKVAPRQGGVAWEPVPLALALGGVLFEFE